MPTSIAASTNSPWSRTSCSTKREKVRAFINAPSPEQCIFTYGTTSGINTVARSWGDANIRAGDEILLTEMEHHSNLVPWQQLAERTGAVLRHIPVSDDGLLELDSLDTLLTERTKLVAFVSISNVLGTINPVAEIIRRAHAAGALALVDGAQSVPHQRTDVQALDCDFLVFSGHKMLGPSGVGVLYGKREILEAMPPFLGGGSMIRRVMLDTFRAGRPARRASRRARRRSCRPSAWGRRSTISTASDWMPSNGTSEFSSPAATRSWIASKACGFSARPGAQGGHCQLHG